MRGRGLEGVRRRIWVAEPMCVELLVETREASEVVELEVGEDCR